MLTLSGVCNGVIFFCNSGQFCFFILKIQHFKIDLTKLFKGKYIHTQNLLYMVYILIYLIYYVSHSMTMVSYIIPRSQNFK